MPPMQQGVAASEALRKKRKPKRGKGEEGDYFTSTLRPPTM